MRALWGHRMAPLITAAAILITGTPACLVAATSAPTSAIPMASCPSGTNWNNITLRCE